MSYMFYRKYNEANIINFALWTLDGVTFKKDAVHAAGDTVISKDEGAEGNTANGFVDEGKTYSLLFSAAEMQCKRAMIAIEDQTSPQVFLDDTIIIETFGHADAMYLDYPAGLSDVDANKIVIAKAIKQYDASGLSPSADSVYDDIITKVDEVPEDLLTEEINGEAVAVILQFIRSMAKGRILKETLSDGDYHTFYLPNATTPLFKLKITDNERTDVAL